MARPSEGEFDQGTPACGTAKERAKHEVGKDCVQDDVHEAAQQTRGIIHQHIVHTRSAIAEHARFTRKLGHEIFVYIFSAVYVPNQRCDDRVCCNQDRNDHQWQAPDFDVVGQKHNNREANDQHQPTARRVYALGVFHSRHRRQTKAFVELIRGS